MALITLQQDANEKISVSKEEQVIIHTIKKFFHWRKDVTINRLNKLGTSQRDKFIKYLSQI